MTCKTKKQKGIFLSWLSSYLLILLIPLAISIFAYTQSIDMIETEINRAHSASLKQVQQMIDSRLKDIEKLSVEIAFNEKIKGMVGYNKSLTPHHIYATVDIINNIKTYKIANAFINDLYIYFKYSNFILGPNGKCSSAEFHEFYCKDYGQKFEEWLHMLNQNHMGEYKALGNQDEQGLSKKIIYTRSLPIELLGESGGVIVIGMNESTLIRSLQDINWVHQGIIMVTDQNDNIVMSTKKGIDQAYIIRSHNFNKPQGLLHLNIKGEEYVVSYIKSSVTGWNYISVLPTRIFLDKAKYIKKVSILSTALCLLIGGWIAYLFSKKNYSPVKRMVDILGKSTNIPDNPKDGKKNEYYYIEQSILHILSEKDQLNEQLDKQVDALRNNFMIRLVKGEIKNHISIQDACEKYGVYFDYENFIIMLFFLDGASDFFSGQTDKDNDNGKSFDIAQFIVHNVVEELMNKSGRGYMVNTGDLLVCIGNFKDEENVRSLINSVLYKSKMVINDAFGINFSVAVSDTHTSFEGIPVAYQEAIEAFEYNMIIGSEEVIYYSDINVPDVAYHGSSFNEQQKFINAIKVGNYKEAEEIFNSIIEKDFAKAIPSTQMLKCKMFGLLNSMILAMEEASSGCDKEFWEGLNPVEKLLKCNTVASLKREMHDILKRMDEYVEESRGKQDDVLINNIMSFVNENYMNRDLSVSKIADRFHINSSYLSRLFKKQAGVGLLDYIHGIRIDHAKKLIDSTDASLKEIGNKVGYYNNIAFIRAFKRYEGITPGQYRDTYEET